MSKSRSVPVTVACLDTAFMDWSKPSDLPAFTEERVFVSVPKGVRAVFEAHAQDAFVVFDGADK